MGKEERHPLLHRQRAGTPVRKRSRAVTAGAVISFPDTWAKAWLWSTHDVLRWIAVGRWQHPAKSIAHSRSSTSLCRFDFIASYKVSLARYAGCWKEQWLSTPSYHHTRGYLYWFHRCMWRKVLCYMVLSCKPLFKIILMSIRLCIFWNMIYLCGSGGVNTTFHQNNCSLTIHTILQSVSFGMDRSSFFSGL